jgi:hypothetical protein
MYLYAAMIPFYGVVTDVGLQITPPILIGVVTALDLFVTKTRFPAVVVNYIIFAFSVSLFWSFNLPSIVKNFPPLRGEYRWIMQLIFFLLNYFPVLFVAKHLKTDQQFLKLLRFVFGSAVLLVGLGVLQYFVYQSTGVDLFPLNTFKPEYTETASFEAGKLKIFRVSSFGAGEPKNFAYTCVIIMTFLLSRSFFLPSFKVKYTPVIFAATLFVFLMTFSTQGYVIFGFNMLLIILFDIVSNKKITRRSMLFLSGVVALAVYASTLPIVRLIFDLRVTQRLETGGVEDYNETINLMLADNPHHVLLGTGLGNVHLFSADYIPPEFSFYMANTVFIAKSGYLRIISDLGLVGLFLFVMMFFKPTFKIFYQRFQTTDKLFKQIGLFLICNTCILFCDYMLTSDGPAYLFFLLASVLALHKIGAKKLQPFFKNSPPPV